MSKGKKKKDYRMYLLVSVIALAVIINGLALYINRGSDFVALADENLAAVGAKSNPTTCQDSDGRGNFNTKGQTYGTSRGDRGVETKWWVDKCMTYTDAIDFTCRSNVYPGSQPLAVISERKTCPNGCSDGACRQALVALLKTKLSSASPAARNVSVSRTYVTPDVVLGMYGIEVKNKTSQVSSLKFKITGNIASMQNFRLDDGTNGASYGASSVSGNIISFTNLHVSLLKDTWYNLTLKADVTPLSSGSTILATLLGKEAVGIDDSYNSVDVSEAANITSAKINLVVPEEISVSNVYTTLGNTIQRPCGYSMCDVGKSATFSFTLENESNDVLYVPSNYNNFVSISTTGSYGGRTVASSTIQSLSVSPSTDPGDTVTTYAIQPGASRTFYLYGLVSKIGGPTSYSELKITKIYYGKYGNPKASNISSGLEALKAGATL